MGDYDDVHTCEQKEISLKLFSIETFLVSGQTREIWELVTCKSKEQRQPQMLIRVVAYSYPSPSHVTMAFTDRTIVCVLKWADVKRMMSLCQQQECVSCSSQARLA